MAVPRRDYLAVPPSPPFIRSLVRRAPIAAAATGNEPRETRRRSQPAERLERITSLYHPNSLKRVFAIP